MWTNIEWLFDYYFRTFGLNFSRYYGWINRFYMVKNNQCDWLYLNHWNSIIKMSEISEICNYSVAVPNLVTYYYIYSRVFHQCILNVYFILYFYIIRYVLVWFFYLWISWIFLWYSSLYDCLWLDSMYAYTYQYYFFK